MDKIRYRVYDPEMERMYYNAQIWDDVVWISFEADGAYDEIGHVGDVLLMAYIGIQDERGNDIYEGDILRHDYYNSEIEKHSIAISRVEWASDWQYDYGGEAVGYNINGFWNGRFYVAGNTHENPELQKEENHVI